MYFAAAAAEAATNPDFVAAYNRLTGSNFCFKPPRNIIEAMVDRATGFKGFDEEEARKFAVFFYEYVWSKLPDDAFVQKEPRNDQ